MDSTALRTVSRLTRWLDGAAAQTRSAAPVRDWDLWRAACHGDARSAQQLVRELTPGAYGLALQLLRRTEDAEDAVQDAFLRLWRSAPTDTHGAKLSTYFNTIVINRCRSQWSARREDATDPEALADLHDAHQASDSASALDERHDTAHRSVNLQRALGLLPVRQRMAIVMWAYADASAADIARTLDVDANAAHQLLHRAKQTLRTLIERDPEGVS
jgi:RNA polymerase sigma-70 factor, ECF subfamily